MLWGRGGGGKGASVWSPHGKCRELVKVDLANGECLSNRGLPTGHGLLPASSPVCPAEPREQVLWFSFPAPAPGNDQTITFSAQFLPYISCKDGASTHGKCMHSSRVAIFGPVTG
eukprot:1138114-Pelagomonas_calceolata.AAC.3